jgi:hypothetical protein
VLDREGDRTSLQSSNSVVRVPRHLLSLSLLVYISQLLVNVIFFSVLYRQVDLTLPSWFFISFLLRVQSWISGALRRGLFRFHLTSKHPIALSLSWVVFAGLVGENARPSGVWGVYGCYLVLCRSGRWLDHSGSLVDVAL